MIRTAVFCAFGLIAFLGIAQAEENPLKNAKVGDWAEYKMTGNAGPRGNVEILSKRKLTEKDDTSVTISSETTVMGRKMPAVTVKIPLDKPYHPGVQDPESKVEKVEEGDEKITVAGKEYDTHWVHYKGAGKRGSEIDCKAWMAKGIPLGGLVKMDGTSDGRKVTLELTGSGNE